MRPDQTARPCSSRGPAEAGGPRTGGQHTAFPRRARRTARASASSASEMSDFLRHYLPDKPGKIVDTEGKVLGLTTACTCSPWASGKATA
ncbi:MAG: hypothetical protein ACLT8E_12335 [Akkermansia sp.]